MTRVSRSARQEASGFTSSPRRGALRSPARASAGAASYASPVSAKPTVSPASEYTRGTTACRVSLHGGLEAPPGGRGSGRGGPGGRGGGSRAGRSPHGTLDPAVLRRQDLLAGVHQHAVPVDEALVLDRLPRLAAVVERDRVRPHVLFPLALLLPVVLPLAAVPEEVEVEVVLEGGPGDRAPRSRVRRSRASVPGGGRRCTSRRGARARARPRPASGPAPAGEHQISGTARELGQATALVRKSGRPRRGPGLDRTLSARRLTSGYCCG